MGNGCMMDLGMTRFRVSSFLSASAASMIIFIMFFCDILFICCVVVGVVNGYVVIFVLIFVLVVVKFSVELFLGKVGDGVGDGDLVVALAFLLFIFFGMCLGIVGMLCINFFLFLFLFFKIFFLFLNCGIVCDDCICDFFYTCCYMCLTVFLFTGLSK